MKNSSQQATVTPEKNNTDYQQEVKVYKINLQGFSQAYYYVGK